MKKSIKNVNKTNIVKTIKVSHRIEFDFCFFKFKSVKCRTFTNFVKDKEEYLENIYSVYGGMTGDGLEAQTHEETPWLNARVGLKPWQSSQNIINDKDIFMEYANR